MIAPCQVDKGLINTGSEMNVMIPGMGYQQLFSQHALYF